MLDSIGREAVFMEWPFPETHRAQMRRAGIAMMKLAGLLVQTYAEVAEQAARAARGLGVLGDVLGTVDEERQEAV